MEFFNWFFVYLILFIEKTIYGVRMYGKEKVYGYDYVVLEFKIYFFVFKVKKKKEVFC